METINDQKILGDCCLSIVSNFIGVSPVLEDDKKCIKHESGSDSVSDVLVAPMWLHV